MISLIHCIWYKEWILHHRSFYTFDLFFDHFDHFYPVPMVGCDAGYLLRSSLRSPLVSVGSKSDSHEANAWMTWYSPRKGFRSRKHMEEECCEQRGTCFSIHCETLRPETNPFLRTEWNFDPGSPWFRKGISSVKTFESHTYSYWGELHACCVWHVIAKWPQGRREGGNWWLSIR